MQNVSNVESGAVQRCVDHVYLVKGFPTFYFLLQKSASMQPGTSPSTFQISFPPRQFDFISVILHPIAAMVLAIESPRELTMTTLELRLGTKTEHA